MQTKKKEKKRKFQPPVSRNSFTLKYMFQYTLTNKKKKDTLYITTSDRISKVHKSKYNNKIILQYEKREKELSCKKNEKCYAGHSIYIWKKKKKKKKNVLI